MKSRVRAILFVLMVASGGAWAQAPTFLQGANQPGALAVPNATVNTDAIGRAVMVPFGQSQGTVTNDDAIAGKLGEYITATVNQAGAVPLTNNTAANVTSVQLTAGDWDVTANAGFHPAGTTTMTQAIGWISTVSATFPGVGGDMTGIAFLNVPTVTGQEQVLATGTKRISVAATTTIYLGVQSAFGTSTMGGYGTIRARRVR